MTPILDAKGTDITRDLTDAAEQAGIPVQLVLGCAIAESNLNPRAERWGKSTDSAHEAIASENWPWLQSMIDVAWADVSFGYMQQVVKFHYLGDRTQSYQNCLDVRRQVFENPRGNLINGAWRLGSYLRTARAQDLTPVDGDELLGACVLYNAGHWPVDAVEWKARAPRIQRYRESLAQAATMLAETTGKVDEEIHPEESLMTAIDDRADEQSIKDALGPALTEEMPLTDCTVRAFNNALLLDVPGAGVYALAEATVAESFRPKA